MLYCRCGPARLSCAHAQLKWVHALLKCGYAQLKCAYAQLKCAHAQLKCALRWQSIRIRGYQWGRIHRVSIFWKWGYSGDTLRLLFFPPKKNIRLRLPQKYENGTGAIALDVHSTPASAGRAPAWFHAVLRCECNLTIARFCTRLASEITNSLNTEGSKAQDKACCALIKAN